MLSVKGSTSKLCLFCSSCCSLKIDGTDSGENQEVKVGPKFENGTPNSEFGSDASVIGGQLKCVFILKEILEYPKEIWASYLTQADGQFHPQFWFNVCTQCSEIVQQCYQTYSKIKTLERKMEMGKEDLKRLITEPDYDQISIKKSSSDLDRIWVDLREYVWRERNLSNVKVEVDHVTLSEEDNAEDFSNLLPSPNPPSPPADDGGGSEGSDWEPDAKDAHSDVEQSDQSVDEQLSDANSASDPEFNVSSPRKRKRGRPPNPIRKPRKKRVYGPKIRSAPSFQLDPAVASKFLPIFTEKRYRSLHKCPHCIAFFGTKLHYEDHLNLHASASEDTVTCRHCEWLMCSSSLTHHMDFLHGIKIGTAARKKKYNKDKRRLKKCEQCGSLNKVGAAVRVHQELHNSGKGSSCPDCGWLVKSIGSHLNKCFSNPANADRKEKCERLIVPNEVIQTPFYCDYCPKILLKSADVNIHMQIIHPDNPFLLCVDCNEPFASNQLLQMHREKNHGVQSIPEEVTGDIPCPDCNVVLTSKSRFDYHVTKNHSEKGESCPVCKFKAVSYSRLLIHMKKHNTDLQFVCELCNMTYRSNDSLIRHQKMVHCEELGLEPIACDQCGKRFPEEGKLKLHISDVHNEEGSRCCEICGKKFSAAWLPHHVKAMHPNGEMDMEETCTLFTTTTDGRYKCNFCFHSRKTMHRIREHLRVRHKDKMPVGCDKCGRRFVSKLGLRVHLTKCTATHGGVTPKVGVKKMRNDAKPFKCERCGKGFIKNNNLVIHWETCTGPNNRPRRIEK